MTRAPLDKHAALGGQQQAWAARYNTWLLIELMPKDVVFSFLASSKAGSTLQLNRHGIPNGAQLILALPCNQALGNGPALLKVTAAHHGPCRSIPAVPHRQTWVPSPFT